MPYDDDGGLGAVMTVSKAVWDDSTKPVTLIGVAGIDVRVEALLSPLSSLNYAVVLNRNVRTVMMMVMMM